MSGAYAYFENDIAIIGNDYIERKFSTKNNHLVTTEIINKRINGEKSVKFDDFSAEFFVAFKVKKLFGGKSIYKERDNAYAADSDDKFFRWVYRRIMNCRQFVGIDNLTMKNLQTAGMTYYLKQGMEKTGLGIKEFLLTEPGQKLMDKYNYFSEHRVDNVVARYKQFV